MTPSCAMSCAGIWSATGTMCRSLRQRGGYTVPVILLTALGEEDDLPRVFDVAYRGSNDRVPRADSSLPSGSGLGPAIAAGLVQAHRGTLVGTQPAHRRAIRGATSVGGQRLICAK
jgi:CheY-like chemotaxis protein